MLVTKAAHRYATALLELAKEQDSVEETYKDVLFIKETIDSSKDLLVFLRSPVIKPEKKVAALEEIFGEHVGELVQRYIVLIAKKNRQNLLDEIVYAFVDKYNAFKGIINAEIYVAKELDDDQQKRVKEKLEAFTDKTVNISTNIQKDLKGGIAVKINDTVINATVKHKLEQLEDEFLSIASE